MLNQEIKSKSTRSYIQEADYIGPRIPRDLLNYLKQPGAKVGTISTFTETAEPWADIIVNAYPRNRDTIFIALEKNQQSYDNILWQRKVALSFLGNNNMAYLCLGDAGVVKAPSLSHPDIYLLQVDLRDIRSIRTEIIDIKSAPEFKYTCNTAKHLCDKLYEELEHISLI